MPHAALGDAESEVLRRHVLDGVGLVEDHVRVGRQEARPSDPQRKIAEEERVVAHQDVGVLHPTPGRLVEAFVVRRTATAHAVSTVALDMVPDPRPLQLGKGGQRSVVGAGRPPLDLLE